ncbi:MAG: hypothetical protein GT601_17455 [Acidaminobacter sp.]|uniref:hypothetical protein n=1 Tax=Acidaminobacter sp. TaxID=1872102 RepID=UPI00137E4502|nr:hypothetical protein [Acidaminobacter sp.]MZQ99456.1 hypothetical protein [Acidaminobacter sp.]
MKLNFGRQIMDTLFIVEGEYEKTLLKRILHHVMEYQLICQGNRDSKYMQFKKYDNGTLKGRVAVFCTEESYIKSINNQDHIDNIARILVDEHGYDMRNSCIFYLFDRDPNSNTDSAGIRSLICSLKNPYENADFTYGGLILLSYPCIESYKVSNFKDRTCDFLYALGSDLKVAFGTDKDIQDNKICTTSILKATNEMMKWYNESRIEINYNTGNYAIEEAFDFQEAFYSKEKAYQLFSSLSCAFIELGIIELED